jgi:hypothetical protein
MGGAVNRLTMKIMTGFRSAAAFQSVSKDVHLPAAVLSAFCHYSLIARSQALRRYFLEGQPWEAAAPAVKDPDRVADPSTLRRWFHSLDSSRPPFSFLREIMCVAPARYCPKAAC